MNPERNGGPDLVVRAVKGFLAGEERVLHVGDEIVVGRSRGADFSVRKARSLAERKDCAEIVRSEPFLSVSRRHVKIHFLHKDLVEVQDLSANGTYMDGKRIDCVALTDLREKSHTLALGVSERLVLEFRS